MAGLTNPFWIAVNSLLRALGLPARDSGTQLAKFVLSSLIAGDGTGTAEIADDLVAQVAGCGHGEAVPVSGRPRAAEALPRLAHGDPGLRPGLLHLGVRQAEARRAINASAIDAFTIGNMLFQSLRLEPFDASFEHLVVDFADQAYQYQANTADYQDKSHAAYYGRAGSPAYRAPAPGWLRHALPGVAPGGGPHARGDRRRHARRSGARRATLPGKRPPGARHRDRPGRLDDASGRAGRRTADFRIQSWRLKKDWSIDITARTVTPSMYDLTVGPKPVDVTPDAAAGHVLCDPARAAWAPYQIQAPSNDALFPGEWTFDSNQIYTRWPMAAARQL